MISKQPTFAKYSAPFCWVVTALSVLIAVVVFTGESASRGLLGALWLAVSATFAVSALYLGRKRDA